MVPKWLIRKYGIRPLVASWFQIQFDLYGGFNNHYRAGGQTNHQNLESCWLTGPRSSITCYFKADEDVLFYGLAVQETRQVEREFFATVKGVWTYADALALCDLMIREIHLESKMIGCEVLARFKRDFKPELLKTIKLWLLENHSANWATTDGLCSVVVAPLVKKHPELIEQLKLWTRDKNLWVRRVSAVALTGLARRGQHLDDAYEIAEALFGYPEDLIHKATGWLLRDAGRTDEQRLEKFLIQHGPRIPRTALRYAIEKFPPDKRKQLLFKTKHA